MSFLRHRLCFIFMKSSRRFFTSFDLREGATLCFTGAQLHKLKTVLRAKKGFELSLFNGRDGEWAGEISSLTKDEILIELTAQIRGQSLVKERLLIFAPPKGARLDHLIDQTVQAGCSHFAPVISRYSVRKHINKERLLAIATRAAEQCGMLHQPLMDDTRPLPEALTQWHERYHLFICHPIQDTHSHLWEALLSLPSNLDKAVGVVIGPEGGFGDDEVKELVASFKLEQVHLGEAFYRVDSAAFLALSLCGLYDKIHSQTK